jgi:hypothetical protein
MPLSMMMAAAAVTVPGGCTPNSRPGRAGTIEPTPTSPATTPAHPSTSSETAASSADNPNAPIGPAVQAPVQAPAPAPAPAVATGSPRPIVPVWPFWPERLRVHPLTRLVTDAHSGRQLLEARIEFFDAHGATTKASGQLTLRLFGDAAQPDSADPLETWNLNLRDLSVNALHYDDVTRTYLMRLEIDPARLTAAPELRAYFVGADGALLNGTMPLRP